jgi:hypothetical protein
MTKISKSDHRLLKKISKMGSLVYYHQWDWDRHPSVNPTIVDLMCGDDQRKKRLLTARIRRLSRRKILLHQLISYDDGMGWGIPFSYYN